jgi:hypothetical protein
LRAPHASSLGCRASSLRCRANIATSSSGNLTLQMICTCYGPPGTCAPAS